MDSSVMWNRNPNTDTESAGWVKLQLARTYVKKEFPYFYNTLIGLIPKSVPGIGTLFVSKKMVLGIDLAWFSSLEVEIAGGCLIHEVMHILRDLTRIEALPNKSIASYAFDIPINDDLKKFGIKLPDWVVYSEKEGLPPGLTGEKYYELLEQKYKDESPPTPQFGSGSCGSCNGKAHDHETQDDTDGGRSEKEIQYFKKKGAADIREYIKSKGMSAGTTPGTWQEFLEVSQEPPIVPWQRIVQTVTHQAIGKIVKGHSDYSLRHPSKRSYALRFMRPGLITSTPEVAFVEDWSGSMRKEMLQEGRVELASAMKQLGLTDVWFLGVDAALQNKPRKITINELMTLPVKGRGGTAFAPAIEAVMKLRPRPELVFYSTDGGSIEQGNITKPRHMTFVWLLVASTYTQRPCNWGIQILMSNDAEERKKFELLT